MGDQLVVGPGAIGGVLAARWADAGRATLLLARTPTEEARLTRGGLRFTGTTVRERLVRRGLASARRQGPGPVPAAYFCVKAQDVAAAARAAKPWIGPETAVIALENGVGHERLLRRLFGEKRVVVGVCYVAAERLGPGRVSHNGGRDIELAVGRGNSAAARLAAAQLRAAGWRVSLKSDEDAMLWTKLCFNAAGNPLGALCAASNGELSQDPALRDMLARALEEAVAAALADGHRVDAPRMRRLLLRAYPSGSRQKNSMLQDLQRGRPTEVDAIVGPVLAAGKRRGRPTPLLERLAGLVHGLERLR